MSGATLGGDDVRAAVAVASMLLDSWRLRGVPLPAWLVRHHQRMLTMSACGHESDSDGAQSSHANPLDTQAVAVMLNMSPRQIRRCAAELGGRKVGRDWIFDVSVVREHLEGSK